MTKPSTRAAKPQRRTITPELVRLALASIPPDVDRETWVRVGMAVKAELGAAGFDLWDQWSQQGQAYSSAAARDAWRSIKAGGKVTVGTLFGIAKDHGFKFPEAPGDGQAQAPTDPAAEAERLRLAELKRQQQESEAAEYRRRAELAAKEAGVMWASASQAGRSAYLQRKGVKAYGLRFLPDGTLLVPMRDAAGELQNVQLIAPHKPSAEGEARGLREKRFLAGGRKSGLWHLVGEVPTPAPDAGPLVLLLAEGYATGATVHEATGRPVAVCFDAGNLAHVARELRAQHPAAVLMVCGDDDRDTAARTGKNPGRDKAATAARAVQGEAGQAGAVFPDGLPPGASDFNDLAGHAGLQAVRQQIERALSSPEVPKARRGGKPAPDGPSAARHEEDHEPAADEAPGRPRAAGASVRQGGGGAGARRPTGAPASAGRGESATAAAGGGGGDDEGGDDGQAEGAGRRMGRDPFELDEAGVWFVARDADGNKKPPMWLCAPLMITARTRTDDANGWGFLLEFADLDHNRKQWAMPASLLSGEGSEWAARLRDMGLQMAPGTRARNLVAQYIDTRNPPERVTCTDRIGWHPGGVFVLPAGCIGTASSGRRYVFQSEAGIDDTFKRHGDLTDWQEKVGALCQGNSRMVFAVCCGFAGPLLRPAGMESGGFHFRAKSSKGKTTALRIAASVWGRPSYMRRWRTTDSALESTAVQHCDGLLILDEISQVDGKVVGDCAYMLANEQEKGRSTRGGFNRKLRTWRLLFLSSGEHSLAAHMADAGKKVMAGQEVRMVDIPLEAGAGMGGIEDVHGYEGPAEFVEALTAAAARYYGTPGRAWLEWLAPRFDDLGEELAGLLDKHRATIVPESASEQVRRVGARFAMVAVAGEKAIEAGILPWPCGHAAEAARQCFNAWLDARGHLDNGEDVAMLRQVRAFLEANGDALFTWAHRGMDDHRPNTPYRAGFKRLVSPDGEPMKVDAAVEYFEKKDGYAREKLDAMVEYLVFPEAFRNNVCKGVDPRAVAELLRKRGHLKCEKDRLMIKHRLPGMDKAPVYHLLPSIFTDEE